MAARAGSGVRSMERCSAWPLGMLAGGWGLERGSEEGREEEEQWQKLSVSELPPPQQQSLVRCRCWVRVGPLLRRAAH